MIIMKSKIKNMEGTEKQFEIGMPKEKVETVLDEVLEEIRNTAEIPGFRRGRAPLDIISKRHSKDAMDEVMRRLIPEAYQEALEEHKIRPVSYPDFFDIDITPHGGLVFKAKVDVYPDISLKKYTNLKVAVKKISVKDEEVEKALSSIRNLYAEFVEIDRPIQKGDFGICDVETFADGNIISKKHENMWIEADKEASMLGMGEGLCGLKKGDKKDIAVTLPESYPDKKYAGKKAVFRVEVKCVKEKKLPEINDELAKKAGKDTWQDVKEYVNDQIREKKETNTKILMKNQIIEQLFKSHSFSVPQSMVKRQLKIFMDTAADELRRKGLDEETLKTKIGELKPQLLKEAELKVRLYFILDEIASKEKIEITEGETDDWLKGLADSYGQTLEDVKKYYNDHSLLDGLKEQIREQKTLDFILSSAVVSEKGE